MYYFYIHWYWKFICEELTKCSTYLQISLIELDHQRCVFSNLIVDFDLGNFSRKLPPSDFWSSWLKTHQNMLLLWLKTIRNSPSLFFPKEHCTLRSNGSNSGPDARWLCDHHVFMCILGITLVSPQYCCKNKRNQVLHPE